MPHTLKLQSNGMIFGAKLLEQVRTMQIRDPIIAQNVQAYMKSCLFPQIMLGQAYLPNLMTAPDIFKEMGPGSEALSVPYSDMAGLGATREIVTCRVAYNNIDSDIFQGSGGEFRPIWGTDTFPNVRWDNQYNYLAGLIPPSLVYMMGQPQDTFQITRQTMLINAFMQARDGMASGTGSGSIDAFASTRAQTQAENTYNSIAHQAMTWVPLLSIVLTCVFYAMFPVIFPLFLLPQTGIQTLKGYVAGFFYLASWGPMYVIIHMIAMTREANLVRGTSEGYFTLANFNAMGEVYNETATIAGYMLMSVPFLAAGLAKGALSIGGQATSILAPAQNAAEAAALEQTTGNYSYGNVSYANSSGNMHQSNQWSDAPTYMTGASAFTRRTDNGTNVSTYGDGNEVYNMSNAISSTGFTPTATQGAVATKSSQASMSARIADGYEEASRREVQHLQALRNSHSQTNETSHGFDSSSGIRGGSSTEQSDRRGITDRAGIEDRDSVSSGTRHEKSSGSNTNYADRYSGGVDLRGTASAGAGVGSPGGQGIGGKIGAALSGNLGWDRSYTTADLTNDTKSSHGSKDHSSSRTDGISEEHGTSASASINDGTFYQEGSFSRSQSSEAFTKAEEESLSKIQSYNESARHYRELSRSLEQQASFAETNGFNLSTDLRQDLANFYSRQERDNPGANLPALYATSVSPTQEMARNAVISKWSAERQSAIESDIQQALNDPALQGMDVPKVGNEASVSSRYSGGQQLGSPEPVGTNKADRSDQDQVITEGAGRLLAEQHRRRL
ncbi:conjugal transfer protein TraG N-terminal domain-containing protein [Sphingomonas sp. PB1R3]|uniref:conjugal transfer protein TraG N-terminal domain-containing protein n=1 Tax=Sphingomonas flavida TaxID=3096154 RepID=UPI002FC6756A